MCHSDEETAIERGLEAPTSSATRLGHYYVFGDHRPGRTTSGTSSRRSATSFGFRPQIAAQPASRWVPTSSSRAWALRGPSGRPTRCGLPAGYEDAGVDQAIFVSQAGRNRHEHICESLELFVTAEMLPYFTKRPGGRRPTPYRGPWGGP